MCCFSPSAEAEPKASPASLYRQAQVPTEKRLEDLLGRMTLEEKVCQLDLYAGAKAFVDQQKLKDDTHATLDAVFLPEQAQKVLGSLGVGESMICTPRRNSRMPFSIG